MKFKFLVKKFFDTFFISEIENKLFEYFKIRTNKNRANIHRKILVQCVEDLYYFSLFGLICNNIKKLDENIEIEQYVVRCLTLGSTKSIGGFLKSLLLYNRFRDKKWIKLYSSYCSNVAFRNSDGLGFFNTIKSLMIAFMIFFRIKNKEDILKLNIDNIYVGDLIYDSYLRFKPSPTINIKNFYLYIIIWQAIKNIRLSKKYFYENNIKVLLTSYSSYIHHGITVRVALLEKIDVYSFGDYTYFYQKLSLDYPFHAKDCRNYKNLYYSIKDKINLDLSKKSLAFRLSGGIDIVTSYMKESAYSENNIELTEVNGAVVIFLHDFYDSPHIYNQMIYSDFLEWFEETIKILERNKMLFYIKPHPNQIEDSKIIVEKLKIKYSHLNFLSPKVSNIQLVKSGILAGISVYGTVAHELTYLGIPVILCGDNPHSSFNFCYEAKTKEEYNYFLENIRNLKVTDEDKYEVEIFYYMHNLNLSIEMKTIIELMSRLRSIYQELDNSNYIVLETIFNEFSKNLEFKHFIKDIKETE